MTQPTRPQAQSDADFAEWIGINAGRLLQNFRRDFSPPAGDTREQRRALRDGADQAAQNYLAAKLLCYRPQDAVLSEEAADSDTRLTADRVWIIDPLDGTSEYAEQRHDWGVHVALWQRHTNHVSQLSIGVVVLPDLGEVLTSARPHPLPSLNFVTPAKIVASRSRPPTHLADLQRSLGQYWVNQGGISASVELLAVGSVAAKVGAVIRGDAHCYVHESGFHQWDAAAPLAAAAAHGLHVSHLDGSQVNFNHPGTRTKNLLVTRMELAETVLNTLAKDS